MRAMDTRIVTMLALAAGVGLATGCAAGGQRQGGRPAEATASGPAPEAGAPAAAARDGGPVASGDTSLAMGQRPEGPGRAGFVPSSQNQPGGAKWGAMEKSRSIKEQENAFVASQLVEQGKVAMRENRVHEAWRAFQRANGLDPGNAEAERLMNEAGAVIGIDEHVVDNTFDKAKREHQVRIDQAKAEVFRRFSEGKLLYQRGEFAEAVQRFEGVLEIVRWMPYPLDLSGYQQQARLYIQSAKENLRVQDERERKQKDRIARRLAELEERRRQDQLTERVRNLFVKANLEFQRENYPEVEALAGQIMALDPDNNRAWFLKNLATDLRHQSKEIDVLTAMREEWRKTFQDIDAATVPQVGVVRFPGADSWSDVQLRAERVGRAGAVGADVSPDEQRIRAALKSKSISPTFNDTPIRAVVQFFKDVSGINMIISPRVFDEQGEDTLRVTLEVTDISLKDALDLVLETLGLSYRIKEGVLQITTKADAQAAAVLRVFDIRDILAMPKDFPGTTIKLEATDSGAAGGIPGLGGDEGAEPITADQVADLIRGAIATESWDTPPNSLEPKVGKLIVRNQPLVVGQVEQLLSSLRASQGMLVTIESRFVRVQDNFLEDVGIDLRGLGNQLPIGSPSVVGRGGLFLGGPGTPLDDVAFGSAVQPTGAGTNQTAGVFFNDNSDGDMRARVENLFDQQLGDPAVMTNSGGLSIQGVFLDDIQIEAILRAVRKTQRINVVTAPRLTAFNAQRANVQMLNQLAYIRDFDVEVAQNATIGDPIVGRIEEGVVLDVRPIVSSDRRFVTLELRPTVAELVRPIPTFSTLLGVALSTPVFIQTPELRIQRVETTVTVPDKGTVLIGGMKVTREEDVKSGVPFLENVPILSFLFGRKGRVHNRSTLLILVRAEVTLLEEVEAGSVQFVQAR